METIGLDGLREMQKNSDISVDEVAAAIRAKQARGEPVVLESAVKAAIPEFFEDKRFLHNAMGDYLIENCGVCKINGAVVSFLLLVGACRESSCLLPQL